MECDACSGAVTCKPTTGLDGHLLQLADRAWARRVLPRAGRGRTQGRLRESPARRWVIRLHPQGSWVGVWVFATPIVALVSEVGSVPRILLLDGSGPTR